jgi:hypothetical protein
MALRIEVLPDGRIELMTQSAVFLEIETEEQAVRIIAYLIRREVRKARKTRFVSQLDKECKQLLKGECRGLTK